MKKYRVRITETRYATVEVEARDHLEAEDKAFFACQEEFPAFEEGKFITDELQAEYIGDEFDPAYDKYDYLPHSLFPEWD